MQPSAWALAPLHEPAFLCKEGIEDKMNPYTRSSARAGGAAVIVLVCKAPECLSNCVALCVLRERRPGFASFRHLNELQSHPWLGLETRNVRE